MNDMKERLIKLTKQNTTEFVNPFAYEYVDNAEQFADYLLTNGVIVSPCKVGDTAYCFDDGASTSKCAHCDFFDAGGFGEPVFCSKTKNGRRAAACIEIVERTISYDNILHYSDSRPFGKTVFLTREEAERALKEREQNEC